MPRIRTKLTRTEIAKLTAPPDGSPSFHWDTELTGFGVMVSGRTGRKTYIVQQKNKRRRIASTNVIPVEEARVRAIRLIDQLNQGQDPKALRRRAQEERERQKSEARTQSRREMTLRQVFHDYRLHRKKLADSTRVHYGQMLDRYLSDWLDEPLLSITRDRVRTRHVEIMSAVVRRKRTVKDTGHTAANAVLKLLRTLWSYADKHELIPDLPKNPVTHTEWYPEQPTRRYIPEHQLKAFYEALMNDEVPTQRDMVRLALFTGMRMGELSRLRWEAVDLEGAVIRQSATAELNKSRRAWELPLSDYAGALLRERWNDREQSPYVFPAMTNRHDRHFLSASPPHGVLERIAHQTAQPVYNPHSLRHTYSTMAANAGVEEYWRNCLLNHSNGGRMASVYTHSSLEEIRQRSQQVTDYLKRLIGLPVSRSGRKTARPGEGGPRLRLMA